jgi:SAM-dependent methyltransferase
MIEKLPATPGAALDVGSGSGRDAAWLARSGWLVVAVEPVEALLAGARRLHGERGIYWLNDSLPCLERVQATDCTLYVLRRAANKSLILLAGVEVVARTSLVNGLHCQRGTVRLIEQQKQFPRLPTHECTARP